MEIVFEILKKLRDKRRDGHIAPDYVPYSELLQFGMDVNKLKDTLNKLFVEGVINVHRGINENLIEILKDDYSPT